MNGRKAAEYTDRISIACALLAACTFFFLYVYREAIFLHFYPNEPLLADSWYYFTYRVMGQWVEAYLVVFIFFALWAIIRSFRNLSLYAWVGFTLNALTAWFFFRYLDTSVQEKEMWFPFLVLVPSIIAVFAKTRCAPSHE